jgi:hypothetical protein
VDPALWLLLRLRLRGWLRRMGRNLGTVKGALLTALGLLLFAPQLLVVLAMPHPIGGPAHLVAVRRFGTLGLFAYCVLTLLLSSAERALYYSPAEVSFLFPGPFPRRQLLAYKLGGQLLSVPIMAAFMAAAFVPHAAWLGAGYVGLILALAFLQLFSVAVALVSSTVGALAFNRGRRLALAALAALALAGLLQVGRQALILEPLEVLARVEGSGVVQVVLTPLRWFVEAFAAERLWPDLLRSAALGLAVDAALLAFVFALDAHYLEASAAASARVYARIERMQRGGVGPSLGRAGRSRVGLPILPWWGGAGPIAWRQLTTALRDSTRVLAVLLVLGSMLVPALLVAPDRLGPESWFVLTNQGLIFGMTLVLTSLVPFDFRADVERMAELKALPIRAFRLALGQLIAPVVLVTALQWTALGLLALRLGTVDSLFWALAAFAPPYNALLFGVENLWCLLFPTLPVTAAGFDPQAVGRMVVLVFAKVVILSISAGVAAGVGGLVYLLSGSVGAALASAWVVLAGSAVGLVPVLALAFRHFDVARDAPL